MEERGCGHPIGWISSATTDRIVPAIERYDGTVGGTLERVVLAAPRGYCAGVDRAVEIVERALRLHGAPVYVRKQIVHNIHVVRDLERKGAVFVEEETEVPEGATVVLSAHGVAPEVYENSSRRQLRVIDATCPLVTKVHLEARRFAGDDRTILLIGHEGHEEVIGTSGEAPDHIRLVGSVEEAATVDVADPDRVSYLSQTTLSVDETNEIIDALRQRFPNIQGPPRDDICYATQNRQDAVKAVAAEADVVMVIGSDNSSNSNRLVEVSRAMGTPAYLIDDETEIDPAWVDGARTVGVTSGASAPEWLVERVVGWLRERGAARVDELAVVEEDVEFGFPRGVRDADLRRAEAAAPASG
jgi:4-hydroxy-3-methylbut-2-enyl diphosphate reductase